MSVDEVFDQRSAAYQFEARMSPGCITGTVEGGWAPTSVRPE
jgi:hypothetical protein